MKRSKKKSKHYYIMPPDGVAVLPQLSVNENKATAQTQVKQNLRTGATKIEKLTGPINEEKRKSNFELFAKLNIPSIASLKSKEEQLSKEQNEQQFEARKNEFDVEQFKNAWNDLCSRIKELGKDSLLVTLTRHQYQLDFINCIIELTIDNKVQEQDIIRERQWLLDVLRNQLQNDLLNFEIKFTSKETINIAYTAKEKFMKMAEKNQSLIYLAEKFKLDL